MRKLILILAIANLFVAAWFGLSYFALNGELDQIGESIFYRCEDGEIYTRAGLKNIAYSAMIFLVNSIVLLIIYRMKSKHNAS